MSKDDLGLLRTDPILNEMAKTTREAWKEVGGSCPFCGAPKRIYSDPYDYPSDFDCGTILNLRGQTKRGEDCYERQIAQQAERIKSLEERLSQYEGEDFNVATIDELRGTRIKQWREIKSLNEKLAVWRTSLELVKALAGISVTHLAWAGWQEKIAEFLENLKTVGEDMSHGTKPSNNSYSD